MDVSAFPDNLDVLAFPQRAVPETRKLNQTHDDGAAVHQIGA